MNTRPLMWRTRSQLAILAAACLLAVIFLIGSDATSVHAAGATLTVNSTADTNTADMVLDLREAMLVATGAMSVSSLDSGECAQISNYSYGEFGPCGTTDSIGSGSADTIRFSSGTFPPSNNPPAGQTITLGSSLPNLSGAAGDTVDARAAGVAVDGGSNTLICFPISGNNNFVFGIVVVRDCTQAFDITGASNTIGVANVGESTCGDAVDNDADGFLNDGCPAVGGIENGAGCTNTLDDDADGSPNDGCPRRGGGMVIQNNHESPGNTGAGIRISGEAADNNVVQASYIGTSIDGINPGSNDYGIEILAGADNNTIGGGTGGDDYRNVISYNNTGGRPGVLIDGSSTTGNQIRTSYIGTDVLGTTPMGNADGIVISGGASSNTIGDTSVTAVLISGNVTSGIVISGSGTSSNVVLDSYIGTNGNGDAGIGNGVNGVLLQNGASSNTVGGTAASYRNIISGNGNWGVGMTGATTTGNSVLGNYIGTNAGGTAAVANVTGVALWAPGNTVGGSTAGARNVISGNPYAGIEIYGSGTSGNVVSGNYIGTSSSGSGYIMNGVGVIIDSAPNNTIGGTTAGERNVISNNPSGVTITGATATGNVVSGNYIGTDPAGTAAIPNDDGIRIYSSANTIGGSAAGAGNLISGNNYFGVSILGGSANIVRGNSIGVSASGGALGNGSSGVRINYDASGSIVGGVLPGQANIIANHFGSGVVVLGTCPSSCTYSKFNTIRGNSIYSSTTGLGIDLAVGGGSGVTPNDGGDGDDGPNSYMNFPVITSVTYDGINTTISGTLDTGGLAVSQCTPTVKNCIDVYSTPSDSNPEGKVYLGQTAPNSSGNWSLVYSGSPPYNVFTATATDAAGSTSEFTSPGYTATAGSGLPLINVGYVGQSVPAGTPGGGTYTAFGRASLPTTGGDVIFWALYNSGANQGIFRCHIADPTKSDCVTAPNTVTKIVATTESSPIGGTWSGFTQVPIVNASGDMSFYATVSGGSAASGIFKIVGGTPSAVALVGDMSPISGVSYTGFTAPLGPAVTIINDSGDVSFFASLSSGGQGIFLYQAASTTTVTVAATGNPAPTGLGNYTGFYDPGGYGTVPIVTKSGQVSFWARVSGAAGQGAFLWDSGTTGTVAAGGDTIPGGGATYMLISKVPIPNNAGQISFWATLSSGSTNCASYAAPCGMFVKTATSTTMVLRAGDAGPAGIGGVVSDIPSVIAINAGGELTTWIATSGGFASSAIVRFGSSTNVAAVGNPSPLGGTFSSFIDASGFPTVPLISSAGQVVFYGAVSGGPSGLFTTVPPTLGIPTISMGPVEGATAPNTGGGKLGPNFDLAVNDSGYAVFSDSVVDGSTQSGLFLFFAGNPVNALFFAGNPLTTLATQDSLVNALGGSNPSDTYSAFGPPVNNLSGTLAVKTELNSSSAQGVYLFFAGNPASVPPPTKLIRTGDWIDVAHTDTFKYGFGNPVINDTNQVAIQGTTNSDSQPGMYLFFAGSPYPTKLAKSGENYPSTGVNFTGGATFYTPSINSSGQVSGRATSGGLDGLYLFFAGAPWPLAKQGVAVDGFTFSAFGDPIINNNSNGTVVAPARNQADSKWGLYLFEKGTNAITDPAQVTKLADQTTQTGAGTCPPACFSDFGPAAIGTTDVGMTAVARGTITGGSKNTGLYMFFAGMPIATPYPLVFSGDALPSPNQAQHYSSAANAFPYYAMSTHLRVTFVANYTNSAGQPAQGVFFATYDQDSDGIPDALDYCPNANDPYNTNTDQAKRAAGFTFVTVDNLGDACDNNDDGDAALDINDNFGVCDKIPTIWLTPTGDDDCDGFITGSSLNGEVFMGTDPSQRCAANSTPNNEATPDRWPFDFNDDQSATITDVSSFSSRFGSTGPNPPYSKRYDFNYDNKVTILDVSKYSAVFGKNCR